ncbi:hypothetical protein H1R20_g14573, partial [Candolleomyces eurysporus]
MLQSQFNPDQRPLPEGWYQHYDTSRKTWYVSAVLARSSGPSIIAVDGYRAKSLKPALDVPDSARNLPPSPAAPKLTAAQRLYASATSTNVPPSVTTPVVTAGNGSSQKDSFSWDSKTPSGPPSYQAPYSSQSDYTRRSSIIPPPSPMRPTVPRAQTEGPLRTMTSSATLNPRRSTMGSSALNLGVPPKPEIKHIVTKAQPPSLLISKQDPPQFHAPIPSQKPLPVLPTITGSTPSLPHVNNVPAQPISPPSAPGAASNSPITVTRLSNASKRNSLAPLKEIGKRVGAATAKFVVSGVSTMIFGADVTSAIGDALSGAGLAQAGVTAILDAQPNADYSTAIAALQQQQLQQPSPAVDYQMLINQIQQLQTIAMQQQQQILTMQLNNISTAGALLGQQQQVNVVNANVGAMAPAFGQQIPLAPSVSPNPSNGYSVPQNSYTLNHQQAASPSPTSAQFSPNQHQTPNSSNQGTPNNPPTTPSYLTFGQQVPSPPPAQGTPQYLHQQAFSPVQQQVPAPPPTQGTPQYLHQQTFSLVERESTSDSAAAATSKP